MADVVKKKPGRLERTVGAVLDNGSRLQAPAVAKYVARLRRAHPDESPAQIITRLENRYLFAVTGSGSAIGATAALPAVGTVAALSASTAETAFFLEASAVFTLSVAAVHGITLENSDKRRALVLGVILGESGIDIVQRTVGSSAKNWAGQITSRIPGLKNMNDSLLKRALTRFAARRLALIAGRAIPAGIGAVIGGWGNRAIAKSIVRNARDAYGPAPAHWPATAAPANAIKPAP